MQVAVKAVIDIVVLFVGVLLLQHTPKMAMIGTENTAKLGYLVTSSSNWSPITELKVKDNVCRVALNACWGSTRTDAQQSRAT